MLPGLYPLQQIIIFLFFDFLMNGKNLRTEVQEKIVLLILKTLVDVCLSQGQLSIYSY